MSTEDPMSIEDRVRTATRAGATLVRDIGPLAAPDPVRLRRRPAPGTRRWLSWGVPLAAAMAVVLVALSLVAVRHFSAPAPAPSEPGARPTSVPRYYVALDQGETFSTGSAGSSGSAGPEAPLIVGDDLTGKTIATVKPPRGLEFDSVQGASDDRTFIVRATSLETTETTPEPWYLLRVAPGTAQPYQLDKLPISSPDGVVAALSADDRELAVESIDGASSKDRTSLGIYSVSSGAELRAWTTTKLASGLAQITLSWLSNGRQLAFSYVPSATADALSLQLRTLDVTAPRTDLLTASHTLLTVPLSGASTCMSLRLTPDGGTIICAGQYAFLTGGGTRTGCSNGGLGFTAYSARTGKLVRDLYRYQGPCDNGLTEVLWTDASAKYVIGALEIDMANQGGWQISRLGVIIDGRLHPLPMAKALPASAYRTVAF